MYQTIHDAIAVFGVYDQGGFHLKKFNWRNQVYPVDQVTLTINLKDGGVKQRMYSVQSGANIYRLLFNRENECWFLEEIWLEG
jgi:hypothetical protein